MKHYRTEYRPAEGQLSEWQMTGASPGPILHVTGAGEALNAAVARLQSLPSLSYLRGTLRVSSVMAGAADRTVVIRESSAAAAYWRILASAAQLGMISGRGVPAAFLKTGVVS